MRFVPRRFSPCLSALLAGLAAAPLAAQEPWEQTPLESDPQALLAAAQAVKSAEGTSIVILLKDALWTLESDGRAHLRNRIVYRLLTEEGAQGAATVKAEWAPWHQERPIIRARVVTPDGAAHLLNPGTLIDKPVAGDDPEIFSDRRLLAGPLPSVRVGAVVEIETVSRASKPFFEAGLVRHHYFGGSLPVQRERLTLDFPEELPVRHAQRLLPGLDPVRRAEGGRTRLAWERGSVKPREPAEPCAPGDVPAAPYVAFCTGHPWSRVADAYHRIVEKQIADADLAGLGELPTPDAPRGQRIDRLLALVHAKVRYTSLALGEASIVPRPPAETLQRGYGDCKDKSALLVAALRRVGIPARVALLLTGPGQDVEPELPGLGTFDHAIVQVPGSPDLWIDPTDKYSRAGSLPLQDQGRLALLAAAETAALVRTPVSTSADNLELKIREVRLADLGPARIVEILRPRGSTERFLRSRLDQERKALGEMLTSYAKGTFLAAKDPVFSLSTPADLSVPFEVKLTMEEAGRGQTDAREAVVALPLGDLWNDLPYFLLEEEPPADAKGSAKPERVHDVLLSPAFSAEWRYRVEPPPGFEARPLPKSETTAVGPALLEREFRKEADGSVFARLRFDTVKARYSAAEAKELRQGVLKLQEEPLLVIGFTQRGQAHLEAGRIREALGEFRKLAADHPEKALHRMQIARALLAGGLGDAARREARKAVEADPGSLTAQTTLGWMLQHDLLGRRFTKGWDPAGAEAAYREALKADPGKLETTLDLAILLEHDAVGRRYVPGPRLEAAIALYRSIAERIAGTQFENNLCVALMRAGRLAELDRQARNMKSQAGAVYRLVAKAALEGSGAALQHAARTIASEDVRRNCLIQAGDQLVHLRHYEQAADLLAGGARGAPQAANLLGRADRIRKCRRWDALPKDAEDPVALVRQVLFATLAPAFDAAGFKPLLSRYLTADEDWAKSFQEMHAALTGSSEEQTMPLEAVRDITLSMLEPVVEGDEAGGWKVVVPPTGGNKAPQVWFVRREEGTLRLLGGREPQIGKLALDLLAAGDLDRARRWLDWSLDGTPEPGPRPDVDGDPFETLWKKGQAADAATTRRAAAVLASRGGRIREAVEILEKERAEVEDRGIRFALDHAVAAALLAGKRNAEAAEAALRLIEAEPDSISAYFLRCESLRRLRKWDDLIAVSESRLKRKPDDPLALRSLQHHEMMRGNGAASMDYARRQIRLGRADDSVYNNLAWTALLEGKADQETLQFSQQAVMASQGRSDASLHTLATVYADLGRPAEARDVLLQTFLSRPNTEPQSHDWYVLGRIAEEYGAIEAATDAYKKTAIDEEADLPSNTNRMSLRRLRQLQSR